jgi:hypothetical protein
MDDKNVFEEEERQYNQSFEPADVVKIDNKDANIKQLDLFMDKLQTCSHKDTMWDTGFSQNYCLECFQYIDDKDAYYSNHLSNGRGYY